MTNPVLPKIIGKSSVLQREGDRIEKSGMLLMMINAGEPRIAWLDWETDKIPASFSPKLTTAIPPPFLPPI